MSQIIASLENNIATLRLNRPEALNALNRSVVDEIDAFLDRIAGDRNIRVLLFYGSGNFAAGADIKDMVECSEKEAKKFSFSPTYDKIEALSIPTIAAIEGYALGGGLELALSCDIRIADVNAKLGFPEINLGIMPGAGGMIRAPRLIGSARAKELIFTGDIINAEKALEIGLINKITTKNEVLQEAIKLAEKLSKKAPIALSKAKATINAGLNETDISKGIAIEAANWASLFNTEDQKEGMRAFIDKRKPVYIGK